MGATAVCHQPAFVGPMSWIAQRFKSSPRGRSWTSASPSRAAVCVKPLCRSLLRMSMQPPQDHEFALLMEKWETAGASLTDLEEERAVLQVRIKRLPRSRRGGPRTEVEEAAAAVTRTQRNSLNEELARLDVRRRSMASKVAALRGYLDALLLRGEDALAADAAAEVPAGVEHWTLKAAAGAVPHTHVSSPSLPRENDDGWLPQEVAFFSVDGPVSADVPYDPSVWRSLRDDGLQSPADLWREERLYKFATVHLPAWVSSTSRNYAKSKVTADVLYKASDAADVVDWVDLPYTCEPELLVTSSSGNPGFNGELKAPTNTMLRHGVVYALLALRSAYMNSPPGFHRFHSIIPTGYALLAFPHVGYIVAVEMVGKVFATPLSDVFVLGSPQHAAAIRSLHAPPQGNYVDVSRTSEGWDAHPRGVGRSAILWTTVPVVRAEPVDQSDVAQERFYKIVTCGAFDGVLKRHQAAHRFRRLHQVYTVYSMLWRSALAADEGMPGALLPASLRYGDFSVMVDMPFVRGRESTYKELALAGYVQEQVAEAIAWLARRGLLYWDLRAPNVMVHEEHRRAYLVDYDDMLVRRGWAPAGVDEMLGALRDDLVLRDEGVDAKANLKMIGSHMLACLDAFLKDEET